MRAFRIVNISNTVPEVIFSDNAIKYNNGTLVSLREFEIFCC